MKNMEFRWLTRYVVFTPESWLAYRGQMFDPDPPHPTERVLQFRVKEGPSGENWWSWGEWQEVPEVDQR